MVIKKGRGTIRGRLEDGTPNPIDTHVGNRVRVRRTLLGMSQERLADELGITFQQVQKYEKGLNRIGASRLWDLAQVLGVAVDFFYDNLDDNTRSKSPRKICNFMEMNEDGATYNDILSRRDVIELIRNYTRITDPKVAKNVLDLVKSLCPADD